MTKNMSNNIEEKVVIITVASHGFLIIAPGSKEPSEHGTTKGYGMADALTRAEAENRRSVSPCRGRMAPERVGLMGYSCGGLKESLKTLHSPIAYFIGWWRDVAYPNAGDDFKRFEGVPVLKASINTGHAGTFAHPGGG
jgi:hypothetical protein